MHVLLKRAAFALAVNLLTASAAVAESKPATWQIPVIRRAVLWLLHDDWGQPKRAYGFERIEETAPLRQKPEPLRNAKAICVDASGWGARQNFLYEADSKTVSAIKEGKESTHRLQKIRLSAQGLPTHYAVKIWWGGQLFFLKMNPTRGGDVVVTEFTDHWLTLGKVPN